MAIFGSVILRNSTNKVDEYIDVFFTVVFGFYISFFFVSDYFTGNGIDESVYYHLRYGLIGASFTEYIELILFFSLAILAFFTILGFLTYNNFVRRRQPDDRNIQSIISRILLLFSFILCPTSYSLLKFSDVVTVFMDSNTNHVIDDYLIAPGKAHIPNKKNILFIYAESLERTYFDNEAFPGLVTGLRQIENDSLTFTNIQQIRGTGWTIAGITASQCGIPLITPSGGNSMSGMDTFLPLAICLGDVLSKENYYLSYLSGSSDEFAGTRKFFATHGFDEILGKDLLSESLPDLTYQYGWGFYDDTVLDIAFERFSQLSAQPKPFGLFISTMDTHHPNGHPSRSCKGKVYQEGTNPILNAVLCSDYLISNFINRVLESPHAEDTIIVLSSDHLAMSNTASHMLDDLERRNLLLMIDPKRESQKLVKAGSMMDIAPTILHLLGYDTQLGLGRNLLGDEEPLITRLYPIDDAIVGWRDSLSLLWNFPNIGETEKIEIFPETRSVVINDRVFKFPILIELDAEGNSLLRFGIDTRSPNNIGLMKYVVKMGLGTPFLWIDECMVMQTMTIKLWGDYCVFFGEAGTANVTYENLFKSIQISPYEILNGRENANKRPTIADSLDGNRFIAHAGGGIDNNRYTNSLEALNLGYRHGFRLFELDIITTSDDYYVAAHDWKSWQAGVNFSGQLPPSRAEFLDHKIFLFQYQRSKVNVISYSNNSAQSMSAMAARFRDNITSPSFAPLSLPLSSVPHTATGVINDNSSDLR